MNLPKIVFYILSSIVLQGMLMSATIKNITYNDTKVPVIFEKHNTLPIFNLQLVFQNSGYINDSKSAGLTSITAKVLNEGTKKDGAVDFARQLENNAISIHTSAGLETFVIEISCLKSEYKQAINYLRKLLNDPNMTQKTLDKLKRLQLSKLEQKENDFDYVASLELKKLTYKGTALEYSSSGDKKSIENITLKDVKNKLAKTLNLDNLIVVVGGDVKFKEIKKDVESLFTTLKSNGQTSFEKIAISKEVITKTTKKETEQSYIYFSSPYYIEFDSKENYKSKVASFILGGSGFGSRLMEEIRVKNGLAYSAYGNVSNKKSYSHFTGYLQTKLDNTQKAKDMVVSIVKDFVKNGVTQKELDAAKNFLTGSEPLRTETFSQRLNRAFHLYYKNLPFNYPQKELDKISDLSLEDLNKFIASHKEIQELTFSIVTK